MICKTIGFANKQSSSFANRMIFGRSDIETMLNGKVVKVMPNGKGKELNDIVFLILNFT